MTTEIPPPVTGTCCDAPSPNRRMSPQVDRGLTARGACRPCRPNRPKGARGHHLGSPWPAHAAFPSQAPVPTEGTVSRAPRSLPPPPPPNPSLGLFVVRAPPLASPHARLPRTAPLVLLSSACGSRISSLVPAHCRRFLGTKARTQVRTHAPPISALCCLSASCPSLLARGMRRPKCRRL